MERNCGCVIDAARDMGGGRGGAGGVTLREKQTAVVAVRVVEEVVARRAFVAVCTVSKLPWRAVIRGFLWRW